MALPALVYFLVFTVYPIVGNVVLTFQKETTTGALVWAGLSNYLDLTTDPFIGKVLVNTVIYMVTVPLIDVALALPLASILKRVDSKLLLVLFMLPSFIPFVTAAVSWELVLNPFYGPVYYFARFNWFTSIWMIVIMDVWESLPLATLVIYAGLKSIPREIEEAANMDGLVGIRKFMQVDLPYVAPNILTALVLMLIFATFTFDPIFVTEGQMPPMTAVDLAYYSYQQFFGGIIGYAAVLILIMSGMSTALAYLFVRSMLGGGKSGGRSRWQWVGVKFPNSSSPRWAVGTVTAVYLLFLLFPVAWLVLESIKPYSQVFSIPPVILTSQPTLVHYLNALTQGLPYIVSSLITAAGVLMITVLIGAPAAYAMSRYGFGGRAFLTFVLFIYSLPAIIFMLPIYEIMNFLGLVNTWWALILSYPVFVLPVVIWMCYNFYRNFPAHVDEAAQVDGMNKVTAFFRMILPSSSDVIAVAVLYSFLISWGALIFPLVLSYSPFNMNLLSPYGAQTFSIFIGATLGHESVHYGALAASGMISLIPAVILLYFMRNRLDKLYRVGGFKG
ncbi:hypothetical protein GCM10007116_05590 [Sulfodiicoccus acidiphilus]|uniref:ABC transmembrane type-1 domain-containing protein n=1 Tax=Sulfodiicoccus acidiphilus TaxID=1670455 RepID=A0A830GZ80_9CREN|nr:hypothetical protein GCM10007116_05590 [Sulfodiicoccus acidiphilus]